MVNLKDNIWIEGFDIHEVGYFMRTKDGNFIGDVAKEIVYSGKTSDIPEEVAKEVLLLHPYSNGRYKCYFEYDNPELDLDNKSCQCRNNPNESRNDHLWDWRESIQSACNQEYCIIFKK